MGIRELAKYWIIDNYPETQMNDMRASSYYPDKDIWFFTFSCDFFDQNKSGSVNILLQHKDSLNQFYFLEIPYSFFRENKSKFDVRSSGDKFDLHISAKKRNWLQCERSKGISFSGFLR